MLLEIRLFAVLRERAGSESVSVELPNEGATVGDALRVLGSRSEGLAAALEEMSLVMAVNREYADEEVRLAPGDELALIPPVSGGGSQPAGTVPRARVSAAPLSAERAARAVASPHSGATVTFQGTTRDVEFLDYEAYAPMAEQRIAEILVDAAERHEIEGIAADHRVGRVPRGEPSVVVAVTAAHRDAAFAAAREAIDRIKAEAPIWKREIDGGHAEWVEGTPPPLPT